MQFLVRSRILCRLARTRGHSQSGATATPQHLRRPLASIGWQRAPTALELQKAVPPGQVNSHKAAADARQLVAGSVSSDGYPTADLRARSILHGPQLDGRPIMATAGNATHREPWNKGKLVGQKSAHALYVRYPFVTGQSSVDGRVMT